VRDVGFYHGGDVLYHLDGAPGIWHEVCLHAVGIIPSARSNPELGLSYLWF
jgi:hypothetical protein